MVLPITAFYASLLGICYLYLSFLVIGARRRHQVGIGDGGHEDLSRLTRAHGNFSEYVPITLIMIAKAVIIVIIMIMIVNMTNIRVPCC